MEIHRATHQCARAIQGVRLRSGHLPIAQLHRPGQPGERRRLRQRSRVDEEVRPRAPIHPVGGADARRPQVGATVPSR